jgi:peptide/nickel transport system substrate-binding protein
MNRALSRLTGRAALLAIALLGAAACGAPGAAATSSKAPKDHVLHLSFLQDPGQPPDPDIYYAGQGLELQDNIYEGLLQYQPGTATPTIVGDLATSWTASPDNRVFTFQLRHGVLFHDGTPFTSTAVQPSFARRTAVGGGPAYMVADLASVTANGPYGVTITLNSPNAAFPAYLASAYGPRMMSPTGLAAHAGSDSDQTYLQTHDLGTGPYTLTEAKVGSMYAMQAFPRYWGRKPYFTTVDMPVISDAATQQLQLDRGDLAIIMHDLPESAVRSYLRSSSVTTYSLPTQASDFLYVNPSTGFLTTQANRMALLKSINVRQILTQVFSGRATLATQAYPAHMMPAGTAAQGISYQPSALANLVKTLPSGMRSLTVGYDSSSPDNQLVANLISAQLQPLGLTVKVQSYPTSEIYGWTPPASSAGAPDVLLDVGWPDAAPPYMWAHISYDPDGGLNYLHCSSPRISSLLPQGLATGSQQVFSEVGQLAAGTGCFYNLVNQDDFMVAQPWLKGVAQAHVVTAPNSLSVAALSA